jgi:L(+)-tartrate dehydratase beta subunit
MPPDTYAKVFKPHGTVYLNTVGYGLGALYGRTIKRVLKGVWTEELGLAQAMWFFDVKEFGPLMVECDTQGQSLFDGENDAVNRKLLSLYEGVEKPILRRLGEETSPGKEMM